MTTRWVHRIRPRRPVRREEGTASTYPITPPSRVTTTTTRPTIPRKSLCKQLIFRIDYFPTQKLHMFGRGDLTTVNDTGYSSTANSQPWLMADNYQTSNPNFVYNVTYTFSPTVVNEFNVGWAGWDENTIYNKADVAKVTLGAGGFNLPSLYAGVNPLNLFPATSFGGTDPANFGWDSRFPFADKVHTYSATDTVTWVWRNHTFKFGVDAQTDAYLQANHNRVGTFNHQRELQQSQRQQLGLRQCPHGRPQ